MLITLIAYLALLNIVILIFAMIVLIALHVWIHCYILLDFDTLIHLFVYFLDCLWAWCLYHFLPDCHSLYVYMSDIFCTLLDCMLHDCLSSIWLHVVCPCGPQIYPPTSNSLGFGHSLYSSSHFCKCEASCVFVTPNEPEIRNRV